MCNKMKMHDIADFQLTQPTQEIFSNKFNTKREYILKATSSIITQHGCCSASPVLKAKPLIFQVVHGYSDKRDSSCRI